MTKYSLRARMMILILAPTLMIGLLLSTFFIVHRYNELQRQLVDAGINIIEPLAVSSEYGMTFHSKEAVRQLVSLLHRRHSDIVRAITVFDAQNQLFVTSNYHASADKLRLPADATFSTPFSYQRLGNSVILRTPILSESYYPDESPVEDAKPNGNPLGYVAIELDLQSVRLQQYKEVFVSTPAAAALPLPGHAVRLSSDARRHRPDPRYGQYRRSYSTRPAGQPRHGPYARRAGYAEKRH
ncbi:hypothetical protein ACVWZ0_003506 [Erwinia sp. TECH1]